MAIVTELLVIGVFAGLMGLDRRGAFQLMLSQPIVALPLLGLFFGDAQTGAMLGALVQLLWMSSSLFGANVPPNETVAGLTIGGMVFMFNAHGGPIDEPQAQALWAMAILLGCPMALAGRWLEQKNDQANLRICRRADAAVRMGRPNIISRLTLWGLARAFLLNACMVAFATMIGWGLLNALAPLLNSMTLTVALMAVTVYLLPAIGLGVSVAALRRRRGIVLAVAMFVIGLLVGVPQ
ncbi:MAG: mannose/fructose/N-acetylgalactosamine-specific phosphotransferase system component IIC [Bradymonadia bacterium]|jgi:mannose/fructose/N-acetylgalactosamine-specific phosphotransferase system component IIC